MKKLIFVFALLAMAGTVFANTPGDREVTIVNWVCSFSANADNVVISDFDDNNGFSALTGNEGGISVSLIGEASNWVFDSNDTLSLSLYEDFFTEDMLNNSYSVVIKTYTPDGRVIVANYAAPYEGPGDYTLSLLNANVDDGTEIGSLKLMIGQILSVSSTKLVSMPEESTLTVRFNPTEEKTDVPEPTSAAYALLGLGSLLGIRRKIRK